MQALKSRCGLWPALPLKNSAERTCSSEYVSDVSKCSFVLLNKIFLQLILAMLLLVLDVKFHCFIDYFYITLHNIALY